MLLIAGLAVLKRRPKLAYSLLTVGVTTLYLLSTGFVSDSLLGSIEDFYPEVPVSKAKPADAIVVLGDFAQVATPQRPRFAIIHETDRLRTGGLLFQAGKAPFILVTGGSVASENPLVEQAPLAKLLLEEMGVPGEKILVEGRSQNTHENAAFSKSLLRQRSIHRILLVTSAFHLRRAAATFQKEGFEVDPFPSDFRTGWSRLSYPRAFMPESRMLFYNALALHEIVGIAVYKLKGWA